MWDKWDMCFLTTPSAQYKESFLEAAAEFHAEKRLDSTYAVCLGYNIKSLERQFPDFIRGLTDLADDSRAVGHWYVDRVLWLIDKNEYIGQVSIRPELCTNYLITYGGHIGYSIRPSCRKQGYGKKILGLSMEESKAMGLHRILVTCNSDNIGSKKIIEYNGGRFEKALKMDSIAFRAEGNPKDGQVQKLRYWIDLPD